MKTKSKLLMMSVVLLITQWTSAQKVGDLHYKITNSTKKIVEVIKHDDHKALTNVVIPEKVSINEVDYTVTSIGESAFYGCTSLQSITIPESVTNIDELTFSECTALTSVKLPSSLKSIKKGLFNKCTALTSVNIPESVTTIGVGAFSSCSSLESITLPESVKSIGKNVFASCKSLKSVALSNSITSIPESAFSGCSALTSVAVPNSVKTIEKWAFYECSNLTSISFPASVNKIGAFIFSYCHELKTLICKATNPDQRGIALDYEAFDNNIISKMTLYVPSSVIGTYKYNWDKFGAYGTYDENFVKANVTGGCNTPKGTVSLTATGGKNPYKYSKDGRTFVDTNSFNDLEGGKYTFWVTDSGKATKSDLTNKKMTYLNVFIKKQQTINAPASITKKFGENDFSPAYSSSSLSIDYASDNESVAKIVEGKIHIVGMGKANITASQAGNAIYCQAKENKTIVLTVTKKDQTITFTQSDVELNDTNVITLNGKSSANLEVSYELISGSGAINGNKLTVQEVGTFKIKATQAGSNTINVAEPVIVTFKVTKKKPLSLENVEYVAYPNPIISTLMIPYKEDVKAIFYDANGKKALKGKTNEVINVESLTSGTYIVKYANKTIKVIKN